MIRWERFGALAAPAVVITALVCLVRGASMFGERWGWLAGGAALLLVAYILDRGGDAGAVQQGVDATVPVQQQMRAVR